MIRYSAWRATAADLVVTRNPCLLHGAAILTSTTGGDATLYEGQDVGSGEEIIRLEGIANEVCQVTFSPPLPLSRGLNVDVGSNVTQVVLHFTPLPKNHLFSSPEATL